MENFDIILEKLKLRRNKLLLDKFDRQLLEILSADLELLKSSKSICNEENSGRNNKLVA